MSQRFWPRFLFTAVLEFLVERQLKTAQPCWLSCWLKEGKTLLDCRLFYQCIFVIFRHRRHFRRAFSSLLRIRMKYEAGCCARYFGINAFADFRCYRRSNWLYFLSLRENIAKTTFLQYNSVSLQHPDQIFAAMKLYCGLRIGRIISLRGKANIVNL